MRSLPNPGSRSMSDMRRRRLEACDVGRSYLWAYEIQDWRKEEKPLDTIPPIMIKSSML